MFNDIHILEKKPAHMAVFLHYVLTYHDPAPVLFHQLSGLYRESSGSTKDMKKWAYEIHSTFNIHMAVSGFCDCL